MQRLIPDAGARPPPGWGGTSVTSRVWRTTAPIGPRARVPRRAAPAAAKPAVAQLGVGPEWVEDGGGSGGGSGGGGGDGGGGGGGGSGGECADGGDVLYGGASAWPPFAALDTELKEMCKRAREEQAENPLWSFLYSVAGALGRGFSVERLLRCRVTGTRPREITTRMLATELVTRFLDDDPTVGGSEAAAAPPPPRAAAASDGAAKLAPGRLAQLRDRLDLVRRARPEFAARLMLSEQARYALDSALMNVRSNCMQGGHPPPTLDMLITSADSDTRTRFANVVALVMQNANAVSPIRFALKSAPYIVSGTMRARMRGYRRYGPAGGPSAAGALPPPKRMTPACAATSTGAEFSSVCSGAGEFATLCEAVPAAVDVARAHRRRRRR